MRHSPLSPVLRVAPEEKLSEWHALLCLPGDNY
jgi:hypothetical protein